MADVHRVVLVVYDGIAHLDLSTAMEPLLITRDSPTPPTPPYDILLAAPGGRPVTCHGGAVLVPDVALEKVTDHVDTLMVIGGHDPHLHVADQHLVDEVRRACLISDRVASVCTGAAILAATGLLDDRTVATHWLFADWLATTYPKVNVDTESLWVQDGPYYTSAGITSGIDLTLALIEADHGADLARFVAQVLVTPLRRTGGQTQHSMYLTGTSGHPEVRAAVEYVQEHLSDRDLHVAALARVAGVSVRQLTRSFTSTIRATPAEFIRRTRIEAAKRLLESSTLTVEQVAHRVGLRDGRALRQMFRTIGTSPTAYRETMTSALR